MAISNFARNQISSFKEQDIISFTENPSGLNIKLYPAQRFMLKLFEKMPLDDTEHNIPVYDKFLTTQLHLFTEKEYYEFLLNENRVSLPYEEYCNSMQTQFQLVMGRRGTKTTTIAIFVCYKLYQLLLHKQPQLMFNILENNPMNITMVSLGQDNANKLFGKFNDIISNSKFFKPYLLEEATGNSLKIWTQNDIEKLQGRRPGTHSNSITVTASPNSPGVRGDDNIFVIMDELAHFMSSPNSIKDKQEDAAIYSALTPSVAAFTLKGTTIPYGKTFIFSSPNGKRGKFYEEYVKAYELGTESGNFVMVAPTWETNPNVGAFFLKTEYNKDPASFNVEFGAQFDDSTSSWFEDKSTLYSSFIATKEPTPDFGIPTVQYFLGADFGLANDGTSFSIGHMEQTYRPNISDFIQQYKIFNPGFEETILNVYDYFQEMDNVAQEFDRTFSEPQGYSSNCLRDGILVTKADFLFSKLKIMESSLLIPEEPNSLDPEGNLHILRPVSNCIVIDYTKVQYPDKGDYKGFKLLPIADMLDWLEDLYKRWTISMGVSDQWASQLTKQLIGEREFASKFQAVNHNTALNDTQYKIYQMLINQHQLKQPYDENLIHELEILRRKPMNKNQIKVEAPPGKQHHDDQFDSIIRATWLCYSYYHDAKTLSEFVTIAPSNFMPKNMSVRSQMIKARMNATRYVRNAGTRFSRF